MTVQERITAEVEQKIWQFRVQDFLVLAEKGSFKDCARAELLDGEIWVLNAIHSRHARVQADLQGLLWQALNRTGGDLRTYVTPSVALSEGSLPEPDLVIGLPHDEGFLPLEKVVLVIEVSDTTLELDLGRKLRIYAAAGVPEYWVVDVEARVIYQHWAAAGDRFAERREVAFGDSITPATVPGMSIATTF